MNFIKSQYDIIKETYHDLENLVIEAEEEEKKYKLNFDILIKIKRAQDEITDINGPQNYINQALLIDKFQIDQILNKKIDDLYTQYELNRERCDLNLDLENENKLDLAFINLRKYDIELKSRYLKLTRVTKKIQEIVTGREEVNQDHLIKAYEQKKKNLDEGKKKRLKDIDEGIDKLKKEIEKKKLENYSFSLKYNKLNEDVKLKETIVNLDKDVMKKDDLKDEDKRDDAKL